MYSKMKTIQSQIMRLFITKDVGETFSNSDKPCESRCSHIHSDKSNHYHLPKIELPKFYGDPLNWASFWQSFEDSVHTNKSLRKEYKLTYLRAAIKDKLVSYILNSTTAAPGEYDQLITDIKQRYGQRRPIHETHVMAIVKHPSIEGETRDELQSLHDIQPLALDLALALAIAPALPVMSLCRKVVKCQKLKSCQNREPIFLLYWGLGAPKLMKD